MKLTMKAFGPYGKKEVIDFNALDHRKLFLISGPTGAGKTTIFDAISYAIFGEANGNVRSPESLKSQFVSEEVMTEVSLKFRLKEKEYFIKRSPKQMRKKKRGEGLTEVSADALLKIYESDKEKPTEVISGITKVDEKIHAVLGISSDQFRQIMMIPQGEFRKLINSDSEQREKVLQRLFNTKIYNKMQREIDIQAKDLKKIIENKINERTIAIKRLKYTPESTLDELINSDYPSIEEIIKEVSGEIKLQKEKITSSEKEVLMLNNKRDALIEKREKYKALNEKIERKNALAKQIEDKKEKYEVIEQKKALIKELNKSKEIMAIEDKKNNLEESKEEKRLKKSALERKLSELTKDYERQSEVYEQVNSKIYQRETEEIISKVNKQEELLGKIDELDQLKTKERESSKKLKQLEVKKSEKEKKLANIQERIVQLSDIVEKYKDVEVKIVQEENSLKELQKQRKLIDKAKEYTKDIKRLRTKKDRAIDTLKDTTRKFTTAKEDYKRTKLKYFQSQAAILAESLKSNESCPVCGSTEHPQLAKFPHERINYESVEEKEKELSQIKSLLDQQKNEIDKVELKIINCKQSIDTFCSDLGYGTDSIESIEKQVKQKRICTKEMLESLRKKRIEKDEAKENIKTYKERKKALEQEIAHKKEELQQMHNEKIKVQSIIGTIEDALPKKNTSKDVIKKKLEEMKLNKNKRVAKKEDVNKKYKALETKCTTNKELIRSISEDLVKLKTKIESVDKAFDHALEKHQISLEKYNLLKKKVSEIESMEKEIQVFKKEYSSIEHEYKRLEVTLKDQKKKDISIYETSIREHREKIDKLTAAINIKKTKVNNNSSELDTIKKITKEIRPKEEKYKKLGHLSDMANGKNKYRMTFERYVLAAFFDKIITCANDRLIDITNGRYLLNRTDKKQRKNKQSGLELEIFDHYTGKNRHVKSLSGGESFKASLALALGLSDVVQSYSGNVRLDTMFIDEGFGTLDEESLDSAINCLVDLRNNGRLVGIISHVSELKERIKTRLDVIPSNQGSSTQFNIM